MAVSEKPTPPNASGSDPAQCEQWLAKAIDGREAPLPDLRPEAIAAMGDAAIYHGVAGLIADRPDVLRAWPEPLAERVAKQARGQAMWELRHRELLSELLATLADNGVRSLVMKGTAVAYDVYANPAARSRGDTDLLVAAEDLRGCQAVLARLGFTRGTGDGMGEEFANQQSWVHAAPDGTHAIDLHWQVLNAQSLHGIMPAKDCLDHARPLPRLSPEARGMDRVRLLLHTCVHRAIHRNAPYFVGGTPHFGSDRLIWTNDIHLLSASFDCGQWSQFCDLAEDRGVAGVCLDGLDRARASLGTVVPDDIRQSLRQSSAGDRRVTYFVKTRALTRAMDDVRAVAGLSAKIRYALARLLPSAEFLRSKYPGMAAYPLPLLYLRRIIGTMHRADGLDHANQG